MHRKNSLYSLLFTIFNDAIGWGIALTIFAPLVFGPSFLPETVSESTRNVIVGFLIGSYAITQFFSMPLIGALSDHFGRKKILEWTLFGAGLSFVLSAYAVWMESLTWLFISRLLAGLFSGNSGTAQASIADLSTSATKAKNLAMSSIVGGISWIVGPPLGGLLSASEWVSWFDFSTPFLFLALLFLINLIWLRVSYIDTYNRGEKHDWKQEIKDIRKLSKIPHMNGWLTVTFLFYTGWFFFVLYYPTFVVLEFQFTSQQIGYLSSYLAIFWLLGSTLLNRVLAEKIKSEVLLFWSLLISGIFIIVTDSLPMAGWLVTIPVLGFFGSICWTGVLAIISNLAGNANQGKVFGVALSLSSLALFLSPLISGLIASYQVDIPLVLGGVVLLATSLYCFSLHRKA